MKLYIQERLYDTMTIAALMFTVFLSRTGEFRTFSTMVVLEWGVFYLTHTTTLITGEFPAQYFSTV